MGLTPKGKETMEAIQAFRVENGYAPTYRELMRILGLKSLNAVHQRVSALRKQGLLERGRKGAARDLEPRRPVGIAFPEEGLRLKIAGTIAAGQPIEAVDYDREVDVPHGLVSDPSRAFLLVVEGDSMVDDHILDGDMVLVEKAPWFEDGDIVVALVDGWRATVKRAFDEGEAVRLEPANEAHEAQTYLKDRVEFQGIVAGVLRRL